jgi:hypothetical protein
VYPTRIAKSFSLFHGQDHRTHWFPTCERITRQATACTTLGFTDPTKSHDRFTLPYIGYRIQMQDHIGSAGTPRHVRKTAPGPLGRQNTSPNPIFARLPPSAGDDTPISRSSPPPPGKLLGFGADNKKIMCYATPNMPKDLSISNVITIGVRTRILVERNAGITLPHKR